MREHSPFPPDPSGPAVDAGSTTAADDAARLHSFESTAGIDTPDFPPPQPGLTGDAAASPWRQRALWLLVGALVCATGAAGTALVRKWQADQALNRLARVAVLPGATPAPIQPPAATMPAPAAADGLVQGSGADGTAPPAVAAAPAIAAATATAAQAAGAAAPAGALAPILPAPGVQAARGSGNYTEAGSAGNMPGGTDDVNARDRAVTATPSNAGPEGDMATRPAARSATGRPELTRAGAKAGDAKRTAATERGASARKAAKKVMRSSGTFRRCPPLGTKGAVMCRWHICNGGAGKEAACRPYLEHRP